MTARAPGVTPAAVIAPAVAPVVAPAVVSARAPGLRARWRGVALWALALAAMVGLMALGADRVGWAFGWPDGLVMPLAGWITAATDWLLNHASFGLFTFRDLTRFAASVIQAPYDVTRAILVQGQNDAEIPGLPLGWLAITVAAALAGWRLGRGPLALLAGTAGLTLALFGQWDSAMVTLASIIIAVPLGVMGGLAIGIAAWRSPGLARAIGPALDLMQTMPVFAYLVPILILFGFSPTAAIIATVIYALPPMTRITTLALARVPPEIGDLGRMVGCTRRQLTWAVMIPAARDGLMVGVNQVIMLSLNMVIIASMIGAGGLGFDVLTALRRLDFDAGFAAGFAIVVLAITLDRLSQAAAHRPAGHMAAQQRVAGQIAAGQIAAGQIAAGQPVAGHIAAGHIAAGHITAGHNAAGHIATGNIAAGQRAAIRPTGGVAAIAQRHAFALAALTTIAVAALLGMAAPPLHGWPADWRLSTGNALNDTVAYINITWFDQIEAVKDWVLLYLLVPTKRFLLGLPWLGVAGVLAVLGWQLGGARLALLTGGLTVFIAATGLWPQAMITVYLCGISTLIAMAIGLPIGILAAERPGLWRGLRLVIDTLQTLPSFVYLMPAVMLFRVGDFTAMIAVVAFAVAPAIRYTVLGLQGVDPQLTEAARAMGCTPWQILTRVKLRLALPEIMLGLNQTLMFALSMLVITALVGTRDLGQEVYSALAKADPGRGLVAGLCVAFIAIIADRLIQAGARRTRARLGLGTTA